MYEQMVDILRGIGKRQHEIEMRIALNPGAFDHARAWFDAGENVKPTSSIVKYRDDSDLRCVDGQWQIKRTVDRASVQVIGRLHANLVVSIETNAPPPDEEQDRLPWATRHRSRWVYTMGNWTVEWTRTEEYCNVELEWHGESPEVLAGDKGLDHLADCLRRLMPCIAYLNFYNEHLVFDNTGIYVKPCFAIGVKSKGGIDSCMVAQQPISLRREHFADIQSSMVSVKYDGIRACACFIEIDGFTMCVMLGRFGRRIRCKYMPCRGHIEPCVLDGELMSTGEFIVFDMVEKQGVLLTHLDFDQRLTYLQALDLPVVMGHRVRVKQFWQAADVSSALAAMDKCTSDGLVFHNPRGRLLQSGTMHKWKPVHTVDLKVSDAMRLRTRKMTVQSLDPAHHKTCKAGEIWEFQFDRDDIHLRPVRIRNDKDMPNSDTTYRDVRTAHKENITSDDLQTLLQ